MALCWRGPTCKRRTYVGPDFVMRGSMKPTSAMHGWAARSWSGPHCVAPICVARSLGLLIIAGHRNKLATRITGSAEADGGFDISGHVLVACGKLQQITQMDLVLRHAEPVGDHLRIARLVPLPVRQGADDCHFATGVEAQFHA